MVVLAQIEDLADDVDMGGVGAMARSPGQIPQPIDAQLAVAPQPGVVGRPTNPVVAARHRDVAAHFLGVLDDRQPATDFTGQQRFAHAGLLMIGDPDCQRCPSVLERWSQGDSNPSLYLRKYRLPCRFTPFRSGSVPFATCGFVFRS